MPLNLTLTNKLAAGTWSASGEFVSTDGNHTGPADVLLQESEGELKLILDHKLKVSKILGREVLLYVQPESLKVKDLLPGQKVTINQVWINLKNS